MNDRSEKFRNLLVPVLSVVLGLILGAILMAAFGFQPIQGYSSMLDAALGSQRGIGETLRQATPLIFTALGFSVANSAGFFNIGLSGQALCGMDRQCLGGTCFSRSAKSCFASVVRDLRCLSWCDGSGCSRFATSIFWNK